MKIGIDLDDTLIEYSKTLEDMKMTYPNITYPQSTASFYDKATLNLEALCVVRKLQKEGHDVYFVSKWPDYRNILNIPSKIRLLIEYFGPEVLSKLIMCWDKADVSLDLLIDDKEPLTKPQYHVIIVNNETCWFDLYYDVSKLGKSSYTNYHSFTI
jgi:hypothetical protein